MQVKINPKNLIGKINAPPSKSYAHRILISAFLSGREVEVFNVGNSRDVLATLSAIESLGAQVIKKDDSVIILKKELPSKTIIDCDESGSTLRFMLPVVSALGVNATITGKDSLLKRPISDLVESLNENGAVIDNLTVNGQLKSGEFYITANVSSQYLTGLLLALPILNGDSKIIFKQKPVSLGYIDITLDVLKNFNIDIEKTEYGFFVKGNQKYFSKEKIFVEGDYSGASFILSSGAIGGEVTVNGLGANSVQGDKQILDVLSKFGAQILVKENSVTVKKGNLNAITYDCENIPDLVQIIAVVSAFAQGKTILKNVSRLKIKESDRINAILDQLISSKIKCEYVGDDLIIYGGQPEGSIFDGGNDHRTVMSACILGVHAISKSEILGAEAHKKSYTSFFDDIKSLGGDINVTI